jgi:tetratricopeptide (TPR) repeat protein
MALNIALDLKTLTELLEITQPEIIVDLKESITKSFGDSRAMRSIIDRQCEFREQTHCSCGNEAGCLILNGIAYLALGESEAAIKELENANQHFRIEDEVWNHIIGLVLIGNAYEKSEKKYRASREFEKAYHVLTRNYLRVHANDYMDKTQLLEGELQNKIKEISILNLLIALPSKKDSKHINLNLSGDDKDYLALFAIPIYGTVEAGPDGILHIEHFDTFTIANKVELQGQVFDVYGLHGTAPLDRQITVTTTRTHGWLRVHGMSMNGWDIPFDENDYVLFYKASAASHLDYVIASDRDPSGEISLIVKRFDATNNQLLSKSKDTSKSYDPIPVNKEHQIIGVVIAVAKASN